MAALDVRATGALKRFQSSHLWKHVEAFAAMLHEAGYHRAAAVAVIGDAVHLGRWAERKGLEVGTLDERAVTAFMAHLPRCRCQGRRGGRPICTGAHAQSFLDFLRGCGAVHTLPPAPHPRTRPALVTEFCRWMQHHRGLTRTTLANYGDAAQRLVASLGEDPSRYDAAGLRAAVHDVGGGRGIGTARHAATVARAFVRYLTMTGRCRPGLDEAILPIAHSSSASLPRYVTADVVEQIVAAAGTARRCGTRDRAIVLLLARLGLRGGDIVRMRLADIDWSRGCVSVAGKGRRENMLPLPQEVGDAILTYLRSRPVVASDKLFLRLRAPCVPLGTNSAITAVVSSAIRRAGVSTPTRGANLLRHSLATAMLREGVSLAAVGVILRHRSPETTAYYAKVDVELLRSVAQPWPGGASC